MRQMCHIEKIEEIKPIENSENLEHARVLGWWGVVRKGDFKVDDLCLIFEPDSILPPIKIFEFMESKKYRVKTCRLRGALSEILIMPYADRLVIFQQLIKQKQGVLVPIERLGITKQTYQIGDDLTAILQVKKYESFVECCGAGEAKGGFPSFVSRTDENRIEGTEGRALYNELLGQPYYITLKLDGTSGTYFLKDGEFGVCSRNNEYRYNSTKPNYYWYAAKNQKVEEWLRLVKDRTEVEYCLQGEVCGPKVQQNKLKLVEPTVFIFNIKDLTNNRYLGYGEMLELVETKFPSGLKMVPLVQMSHIFSCTIEELYQLSEQHYFKGPEKLGWAEGIVVRHSNNVWSSSVKGERLSFKVINKKFLLNEKDNNAPFPEEYHDLG